MQNNVTELSQRLLRSLDSNYNVIDMPAVIDIISLLEKVAITKELLEATRLGKHINELRRKTANEGLSKRAKGLLKKWRSMVIPSSESNGQLKTSPPLQQQIKAKASPSNTKLSPPMPVVPKLVSPALPENSDVNLNQVKAKKRPAKEALDNVNVKRARVNGVTDLDFSDNSNSSFKDVIASNLLKNSEIKRDVIVINSDSNSSFPENRMDPHLDHQIPKRRGRKKGSKNHKNLIDEAESSFTNKLAVSASRGNSKVKTTQELLASIQNKNSVIKPKEDLMEKAAKLTERVQVIDQKLNTNANRNRNSQKGKIILNQRNDRVIESGSVINDKSLLNQYNSNNEDEIVVVDDIDPEVKEEENNETEIPPDIKTEPDDGNAAPKSLSIEEALARLPPIDKSVLYETDQEEPRCCCYLKENKSDFSITEDDEEENLENAPKYVFIEDESCPAKFHFTEKYHTDNISDDVINRLHTTFIHGVNGINSVGTEKPDPEMLDNDLYVNVVPNIYEKLDKDVKYFDSEDYKRYRVSNRDDPNSDFVIKSESGGDERTEEDESKTEVPSVFREWYECAEKPSYNGEVLKILPYVILD